MFVDGESCPAAAVLGLPVVVRRVPPCATSGVVFVCFLVESAEQVADVAFVYGQFLVVLCYENGLEKGALVCGLIYSK